MPSCAIVAVLCLALFGADQAHAGCGHVKRVPRDGVAGSAPLAIGDSVMLGAAWKLSRNGFEVDAKCGRSPRGGLYVMRRRKARGMLPEIVVVALGTNFFMRSTDIARMRRVLGPQRTLMLVTPFRSGRPVGGAAIRQAARRHPGRVVVIDWSSYALHGRGWFWGDGTHLRNAGERAYTRLLHSAVWARQRGRFG